MGNALNTEFALKSALPTKKRRLTSLPPSTEAEFNEATPKLTVKEGVYSLRVPRHYSDLPLGAYTRRIFGSMVKIPTTLRIDGNSVKVSLTGDGALAQFCLFRRDGSNIVGIIEGQTTHVYGKSD